MIGLDCADNATLRLSMCALYFVHGCISTCAYVAAQVEGQYISRDEHDHCLFTAGVWGCSGQSLPVL